MKTQSLADSVLPMTCSPIVDYSVLAALLIALVGWYVTARLAHKRSRRQHTFQALLDAGLSVEYNDSLSVITQLKALVPTGKGTNHMKTAKPADQLKYLFILNFYEFVAAGVRNGDIDEQLIRDSEGSTIILTFDVFHAHVYSLRSTRSRQSSYEHLEWIRNRWTDQKPGLAKQLIEWFLNSPIRGKSSGPSSY